MKCSMLLIASNLRRTSDKAWIIIGCSPRAEKASPLRKLTNTSLTSIPLAYEHATSSTLNSSEKFKTKNKVSFQENYNYYIKKWGRQSMG